MECCVCLEKIKYYSYLMNCNHDLCEKCAYQMFVMNSKNKRLIIKHGASCYLSCPLCRTDSILNINGRDVYNFDILIKMSSVSSTMYYIHNLYKCKEDNIPYVFIMYPDGCAFILDPITKYIYDAYNEKYKIGCMKSKKILYDNETKLQTWIVFYLKAYIYLHDFITCKKSRLRFKKN
jgi:hypothetical protein